MKSLTISSISCSLGYAAMAAGLFCAFPAAQAGPYVPIIPPYATNPTPPGTPPSGPEHHTSKEYSDELDRDAAGNLDSQQNIAWDGSGGIKDTFDYNGYPGAPTPPNPDNRDVDQVDAIANVRDYLFHEVRTDNTAILYSTRGQSTSGPNVQGEGRDLGAPTEGCGANDPVCYEVTKVRQGGTWATGPQVNQHYPTYPVNLDGLEIFGSEGEDDANRFSLFNDAANNCAVFRGDGTAQPVCYITHGEIAALFTDLNEAVVDIDGLMVFDESSTEAGLDTFDTGDWILFSLWPVLGSPSNPSPYPIGDAVWAWQKGDPNGKTILTHGGHQWNEGWLGLNIDALESAAIPEPTSVALLGIGAAALGFAGRRRRS